MNATELTRELVRYETINPPGSEKPCAEYLGAILADAGFRVAYDALDASRASLVADVAGSEDTPPLCLTGHLDTVPLGEAPWRTPPLAGETDGDRLYGRGTTDMKSGVAAMAIAAIQAIQRGNLRRGLKLVFTAGEETGCDGAKHLAHSPEMLGNAGAVVVGEPTRNTPFIGHKGALWLRASTSGKSAHGSMPEQGDNAIYKAARAVAQLEMLKIDSPQHPLLGNPTLNVGTISGGSSPNLVPDRALIGIDIRSVPGQSHDEIVAQLQRELGESVDIQRLVDIEGLYTEGDHPWVTSVCSLVQEIRGEPVEPASATYFTDGPVLAKAFGHPPTLILGPGEPTMAHQTDEYCSLSRIEESTEIYARIIQNWSF